jgi:hypothetical protein
MALREDVAERLFSDVMAPLVLGGAMRPGHPIGVAAALAIGDGSPLDTDLAALVQEGRVRRARMLVPVDGLGEPSASEWALAAALHDLAQSTNPGFVAPLRRTAAARIVRSALATMERVGPPSTLSEAVSRHTWFSRVLEIARTDTAVSWWAGSQEFLGVDPPSRVQAWPKLRRVSVTRTPRPLIEVGPIAIDRERLVAAMAALLARTPITDLATCTRGAPAFAWNATIVALLGSPAGRTLGARAIARLPAAEVDAALGRACGDLIAVYRALPPPILALLADRAIAEAQGYVVAVSAQSPSTDADIARCLGAAAALDALAKSGATWPEAQRRALHAALEPSARRAAAIMSSGVGGGGRATRV